MASKKTKYIGGKNAVIYARYSSNNQKEESIEQQVNKCQEFANRKGYTIIEIYSDAAMSGKDDNRPAFQKMMRDSEKGKFGYVIAWKSNRMGRDMMKAMEHEVKLREAGVRCLYVEEDFTDTAAGRFALRNMMNVNQFYIENMAEDILRGLMDNASKCLVNTRPPFGYRKGEDKKFAIDEKTAPIVQEIFQKFLDGWAYIDIAHELNRRGIKTAIGNDWNKGSFHSMLRNEMYTGVYMYRDVRIEGGVPVIIDKKTFEEVQRQLSAKKAPRGKKNGTAEYLLTGRLFCGHCGEAMVGISGTGRHGETHYYYRCQGRHYLKNGCQKSNVQRDQIENAVIRSIKEFIMCDEILDRIVEDYQVFLEKERASSGLDALEEELKQNKKSTANLLKVLETGITSETIANRIAELEAEREELEAQIIEEKASLMEIPADVLRFQMEQLRDSDFDDRKVRADLIWIFVKAIYLFDDHLKIVFYFDSDEDHTITFEQIRGEDTADIVGSYTLPSGVLIPDDTNPMTVTVFLYGFVITAPV